jgi:transcriptional regulator with XRE-family HTH domain
METFGDRLRMAREANELVQGKLAIEVGLESPMGISKWESNQREPDLSKMIKICEVLFVDIKWLVTGELSSNVCLKIQSARRRFSPNGKIEAFAMALGISPKLITAIEDRKIMPSEKLISKIACKFKLNKHEIMLGIHPSLAPLHSTGDEKIDYEIITTSDLSAKQKEIIALLKDDSDAEEQMLKILHGRKLLREGMKNISNEREA